MKKVCVIGLGYIGLPTAALFSKEGIQVTGVDVNQRVVDALNNGEIIIEEPDLPDLVKQSVKSGHLKASTIPEEADTFMIAVPTPIYENQTANINYVEQAVTAILPYVKKGNVIIVESTIPPRTIADVVAPLFTEAGIDPESDIHLAHCPERVLPGKILTELIENTRIVGGHTPKAAAAAKEVYRTVVEGDIIETTALTAEMSKLMENTFRDVNIALANELVKISDKLGVNAHEVIRLANLHPRVNLHQPGPGVGGHCLAVDPYFIVEKAVDESRLIQTSREINNSMPAYVVDKVKSITAGTRQPKVAVLGLTYKGNVDDVRESPAMDIVHRLKQDDAFDVTVHDPHVKDWQVPYTLMGLEEALTGADMALILTDHNEFKGIEASMWLNHMATPLVFDTKHCYFTQNDTVRLIHLGNTGTLVSRDDTTVEQVNAYERT